MNMMVPTNVPINFGVSSNSHARYEASIACGFGIAFLTMGALGLLIPLVNTLIKNLSTAKFADLSESSSRMFTMAAIWLSVAIILAFGVFHLHWTGTAAMLIVLVSVGLICGSAVVCTAIVFGWKPWSHETARFKEPDQNVV